MAKTKILVVEDESIVARDLQYTLESLGYAVPAIVSTGEEAIEKAAEIQPDLVLMDIKLRGEMNGVEAVEEIRARFDIPVLYITALTDEKTFHRAINTEPYGYIIKPFEERELRAAIKTTLYKHRRGMKPKRKRKGSS